MTDQERNQYVDQHFLECIKPITNVRRGTVCSKEK